ncbi:MAG: hypothetical protein GY865_11990 [candidate division Zixibacteria bacterium]|nr:hypothetical protein [candidate division Zixibacteria bacterium]
MYCSKCGCDFVGWKGKCPIDNSLLSEKPISLLKTTAKSIQYQSLVDLIKKNNGELIIDLQTTEVGKGRKFVFPGRGNGFAWAKRIEGQFDNIPVELQTTEVGTDSDWSFPHQGYGFAWEKQMTGFVGGNKIVLDSTKVERKKQFLFPYRGHGYAWSEELTGNCGSSIIAKMVTTDISRERNWFLFYFAFGYAWINKASLHLFLTS